MSMFGQMAEAGMTEEMPMDDQAQGGLAQAAQAVQSAGRNGDDYLVHINGEELQELVDMWGEPTINPETGMPEFFMKQLKKALGIAAPILTSFLPGIGQGIGSALLGTVGQAGALGGTLAPIIGNAALGAGIGGLTGGSKGALRGALISGGTAAAMPVINNAMLGTDLGRSFAGSDVGKALGLRPDQQSDVFSEIYKGYGPQSVGPVGAVNAPRQLVPGSARGLSGGNQSFSSLVNSPEYGYGLDPTASTGEALKGQVSTSPTSVFSSPVNQPVPMANVQAPTAVAAESSGLSQYALPALLGLGTLALSDDGQPQNTVIDATQALPQSIHTEPLNFVYDINPTDLSGQDLTALGFASPQLYFSGTGYTKNFDEEEEDEQKKAMGGLAQGRYVGSRTQSDGRADDIPAKLSNNEYVIDADTVALMGDGNPDEGARRLDKMRANVRKHKGKNLAKGKIAHKAKMPEKYLGGR